MADHIQNSLLSPLSHDPSTQIVMVTCLVAFDESFSAEAMHNPG
jgi:hypothetical protein